MKNTHVFILCSDLGLGGVQKKIIDIVNFSGSSQQYSNLIFHIFPRLDTQFSFSSLVKNKKVFFHFFRPPFLRRFEAQWYRLFLLLQYFYHRPRSILLFSHDTIPYILPIKTFSFWQRSRLIVSNDNVLSFYNQPEHLASPRSPSAISDLFRHIDTVITQTQYAKNDLIENFTLPPQKIEVIPNWFLPPKKLPQSRVKKYDLIYAGRFVRQKRLELFIQVVEQMKEKYPRVSACLVGDGTEEGVLKKLINTKKLQKNITLQKPHHHILSELTQAKILLITSEFEGQPMVLLEAMAMKIVPVILEYPGVREYVTHRQNGYVEKSFSGLAKRVAHLLQHPEILKQVGAQAAETVRVQYNYRSIEKVLALL
jgi:glycosyltransferase involved in cell wall biosynthesis